MPIPKRVARFNRLVTNRITRPFAGWLPGFAVVTHRGRRSGRTYRTPVNVFRDGDRWVFALTYGPDSDWVRNVIAAGGCGIRTRGELFDLHHPERFVDPTREAVPVPVRWILRLIGVQDFMSLTRSR